MRTEFYYRKSNAVKAAEEYARKHGGLIRGSKSYDHKHSFDFEDDEVQENLCWSGEVDAILVVAEADYSEMAAFAYWDNEL
ncbi:MAG: hypothetical protein ACTTGW_01370 [Candidatus Cryptobacteroides sp.]|jgi:hypothetical protein